MSELPAADVCVDRTSGDTSMCADPVSLVPEELAVLRLMATGHAVEAIARELVVSPNTVRASGRRMFQKLGAVDRATALEAARGRGLLQPV